MTENIVNSDAKIFIKEELDHVSFISDSLSVKKVEHCETETDEKLHEAFVHQEIMDLRDQSNLVEKIETEGNILNHKNKAENSADIKEELTEFVLDPLDVKEEPETITDNLFLTGNESDNDSVGDDEEWELNKPSNNKSNLHIKTNGKFECNQCEYKSNWKRSLENHIANKHLEIKTNGKFECNQCEYKSNWKHCLKNHIANKHSEIKTNEKFECNQCEYKSNWKHDLNNHIANKHDGRIHYCNECDYQANTYSSVYLHKQSKHRGTMLNCNLCDYKTVSPTYLKLHTNYKHKEARYLCDKCEFKTTKSTLLRLHMESKHEGIKYACDQCDHMAARKNSLKQHKEVIHGGANIKCDQCDYIAPNKKTLTRHKLNKHEGFGFSCSFDRCNYKSIKNSYVKAHERKHKNDGAKYPCDQCDFVTKYEVKIIRHKKTHNVNFICDQCEFIGNTKAQLMRHKEYIHEGVRYFCSQCEYNVGDKHSLKKHETSKHGPDAKSKPNLVKFSSSKTEVELEVSKRIDQFYDESGVHKHKCIECGKICNMKAEIRFHIEKHHLAYTFTCAVCDREYDTRQTLNRHIIASHKKI